MLMGCPVVAQIEEEAVKMAQYTEFRFVCVVGGGCQHDCTTAAVRLFITESLAHQQHPAAVEPMAPCPLLLQQ